MSALGIGPAGFVAGSPLLVIATRFFERANRFRLVGLRWIGTARQRDVVAFNARPPCRNPRRVHTHCFTVERPRGSSLPHHFGLT
jgi:hypothetical protein